jgi:hypothetical protein
MVAYLRMLFGCSFALLLAGCAGVDVLDPVHRGPFFVPKNFQGDPSLGGIRRVVLLPVAGGTVAPAESAAALDAVVLEALQATQRFEVVTFSREECLRRFRKSEFSSAAALPHGFLDVMKQEFAADAVMFVDLTVFNAYRPLSVGLRAKLAAIDGPRLVWSFDTVFPADEPAVANAARRHFLTSDRGGMPVDTTAGALQSPTRFAGYAAATMFSTLPPVLHPLANAKLPAKR